MALVLGVKVGEVIDIAEHWLTILSIDDRGTAILITETGWKTVISSCRMTEVISNIWVGLEPGVGRHRLRLLITAPRHFPITRRAESSL